MRYNPSALAVFKKTVTDYYRKNRRLLPWRESITPYGVLVSEIMLQQTQVSRVLLKYPSFLARFPGFQALASATTSAVLKEWQGMGYNRRGLYLKKTAETIMKEYGGHLPRSVVALDSLPGIGAATATAIVVYTYNIPAVFIETNIRRVFIHHFFTDRSDIDDEEIAPLVEAALDTENPREWYYSLMDYGSHLAKTVENPNRKSRHYAVQSAFSGSDRQLRGKIIRLLLEKQASEEEICNRLHTEKGRIDRILGDMEREGFLRKQEGSYSII